MTRVIFYVNVADRSDFLRRFLHRKVFMPRQTALIYAAESALDTLDKMLWETGFLPHQRLTAESGNGSDGNGADAPIMLTAAAPPPEYSCDILISLVNEVPTFAGSFPVLIDMVGNSDESKKNGRQRYLYFKDNGYSVEVMDMAK